MHNQRGIAHLADGRDFRYGSAAYVSSAAYVEQLPLTEGKEFCIIGRSNVGKSSFLNHVLENNSLAKVSKTPGKTRLANLFKVNETVYWVDLPGYGFAKVSASQLTQFSELIVEYFTKRTNCAGVLWLIDSRHVDLAIDKQAFQWLRSMNKPLLPILTKTDKLSHNLLKESVSKVTELYHFSSPPILYTTARQNFRQNFWNQFVAWSES